MSSAAAPACGRSGDRAPLSSTSAGDWGGGVGGILYSLRGTPSFSHSNSHGDIVAKIDGAGALTYQASYDAFGRHGDTPSIADIIADLDRQKANSKDEDPTGLLNEGLRYRDLETGRLSCGIRWGSWMGRICMRMRYRIRGPNLTH